MRADQREAAGAAGARGGLSMQLRTRQSLVAFVALAAFAALSWLIFRGYLTPEMMVYFLSFKWCL